MKLSTVAAALAALVIPAIAGAHGGNNDPSLVHACVGNLSKVARIVGVSGSCIGAPALVAETPVHWAAQGTPGAPGVNGTNGSNGTNGAPGVNGTNGRNGIDGINGTNGLNGINGADGISVSFLGYLIAGDATCPNGGAVYVSGNPPVNTYICNGISGAGGTRADGACFDNTNRYVDCGNGTMTDTVTGLVWLKSPACLGLLNWAAAHVAVANLKDGDCGGSLTDHSASGDWRLPTKEEWLATIARAVALGCTGAGPGIGPSLTNDAGTACLSVGPSSFVGVAAAGYWSGTGDETTPTFPWSVFLGNGFGNSTVFAKAHLLRPWPVRSAPR